MYNVVLTKRAVKNFRKLPEDKDIISIGNYYLFLV